MRTGDGLQRRGKTWYLDARINGQRYVTRLGKGISRSVAAELAAVKRATILKGEAGIRKKKDLSFAEARDKFEAWVKTNKRPNTVKDYAQSLKELASSFGTKTLAQIHPFHVEQHKALRVKQGTRVRANRELATLKALFNRCREWRVFEGDNPVTPVKLLKEPKTKVRFLESEEEDRLRRAAGHPLESLIVLCVHTGVRMRSEAFTLQWEHIDLKRGLLPVIGAYAKSGELRTVPLNDAATEALVTLQAHRSGELVFTQPTGEGYKSMRQAFDGARDRAGLPDVTPHTLRHTFASRLAMKGVDLPTIMELGGWKSLSMVQRYSHLSPKHVMPSKS
jgi:integrase